MKVLYIAEIIGKAGMFAIRKGLPELLRQTRADFVIVEAESATGGGGLGRGHAMQIKGLGVHAITVGDRGFYKKDLVENIEKVTYVLRPENLPSAPGRGSRVFRAGDMKIAVVSLIGQSGFLRMHGDNPASVLFPLVERLKRETPIIVIDYHAQPTAEKRTFFALADGYCSAIIGSHTRVQTADEIVMPNGTAVITDAGRTGCIDSVGGSDAQSCVQEYLTGIPNWTKETYGRIDVQGVLLDIDKDGTALSIERFRHGISQLFLKQPDKR